jgi:hypothetical protein
LKFLLTREHEKLHQTFKLVAILSTHLGQNAEVEIIASTDRCKCEITLRSHSQCIPLILKCESWNSSVNIVTKLRLEYQDFQSRHKYEI